MFNEVSQEAMTNSSANLAKRVNEKQSVSVKIDNEHRDQGKIKKRNDFLLNEIKNCIPTRVSEDGQLVQ